MDIESSIRKIVQSYDSNFYSTIKISSFTYKSYTNIDASDSIVYFTIQDSHHPIFYNSIWRIINRIASKTSYSRFIKIRNYEYMFIHWDKEFFKDFTNKLVKLPNVSVISADANHTLYIRWYHDDLASKWYEYLLKNLNFVKEEEEGQRRKRQKKKK